MDFFKKTVGVICIGAVAVAIMVFLGKVPLLEDKFHSNKISPSLEMDAPQVSLVEDVEKINLNMDVQPIGSRQSSLGNKENEVADQSLKIVDKPVLMTDYRKQLAREYAEMHYGQSMETIAPQAIIIHWTASDNMQSVYNYFYDEEATTDREYGKLNLTSHFIIDRDGVVYRLTPETCLNRHAIGLNWCSIGIENVGGVDGKQDLTESQLQANIQLVKYLKNKFPTIVCLLGHYQQEYAETVSLWKENVPDYYAGKSDPGPIFMQDLINGTADLGLITFQP